MPRQRFSPWKIHDRSKISSYLRGEQKKAFDKDTQAGVMGLTVAEYDALTVAPEKAPPPPPPQLEPITFLATGFGGGPEVARRRRRSGFTGTLLTGPGGLLGQDPRRLKTLLGG